MKVLIYFPFHIRPERDGAVERQDSPELSVDVQPHLLVQGSGLRVWGLGCRIQASGFRVQGLGFRDVQPHLLVGICCLVSVV